MKTIKYLVILCLGFLITSCEKFMEPQLDNYKTPEYVFSSSADFQGVLYNAYQGFPSRINFTYEAATDNAVTNTDNTNPSKAARGSLNAISNPLGDNWGNDYTYLNRINQFMEKMVLDPNSKIKTPIKFVQDSALNIKTFYYLKGEAFFLRAWYQFDLLQKYGGKASDGRALGYPITRKYLTVNDNLDLPRNTYEECALSISADCDSAARYLPLVYSKASGLITDGLISYSGHASGIAAKVLKAKTLLYAASPAYTVNDVTKWDRAAKAAAEAIALSNGGAVTGFDDLMTLANYYSKNNTNSNVYNNKDQFLRGPVQLAVITYESENFPPRASGGGGGLYNPTQNLVDAFPMKDGYPRGTSPDPLVVYDPVNVEKNRDPRLDLFIVRNGETFPTAASAPLVIGTLPGGLDAYGTDIRATRTGYYLQKMLDPTVNINAVGRVTTQFGAILLGKPELYLNFAEAAINANGNPNSNVVGTKTEIIGGISYTYSYSYNARAVLAKVRNRALGSSTADKYLANVTAPDGFLSLVKNERRIELCFEDSRFWDLRRWSTSATDKTAINQPAWGIYSTTVPVEIRSYKSPYMPLPYNEILKTQNLINNAGW